MSLSHLNEDLLEQYARGKLAEAEAAPVEEHLLVCEPCQDRLRAIDQFIAALRAAEKPGT